MNYIKINKKVQNTVSKKPSKSDSRNEWLKKYLFKKDTVQFFVFHAKHIEWLEWLNRAKIIDSLFDPAGKDDETTRMLAQWIASNFLYKNSEILFNIIQQHQNKLNPLLWQAISIHLRFHRSEDSPQDTFARWILLLMNSPQPFFAGDRLSEILSYCRYPQDRDIAIILFEYLTNPHLDLGEVKSAKTEQEAFLLKHDEIYILGEDYYIRDIWDKFFLRNLENFAEELIHISTHHIEKAFFLYKASMRATDDWDPSSYSRSAIEPHEQNRGYEKIDILIDVARDSLEWIIKNKPLVAKGIIEQWTDSPAKLLNRLAIYGVNKHDGYSPNQKINWMLRRGWLYDWNYHHEIYHLLKSAYPESSVNSRKKLLREIEKGPEIKDKDEEKGKIRINSIYRRLNWLAQWDESDQVVKKKIEDYDGKYTFVKADRKHPDLTHWTESGSGYRSPLSVQEMLGNDPDDENFLNLLLTHKGSEYDEGGREGILRTVDYAVSQSFDWGWRLIQVLKEKDLWDIDVWSYIFSGFVPINRIELSEEQWQMILNFIIESPRLLEAESMLHRISDLLERGISAEENRLPSSVLPVAKTIAADVIDKWEGEVIEEETAPGSEIRSWLDTAINQSGGKIGEFLLRALEIDLKESEDRTPRIPDEHKSLFRSILTGKSYDAAMGRVVLASRLWWLWALDSSWIEEHMLPIFDWDKDERRAEQAWHGYLFWGRWTEALLPVMMPYYKSCFPKQKEHFSETIRSMLSEHLASIALFGSIDPIEDGWLSDYLIQSEEANRVHWAEAVNRNIDPTSSQLIQKFWSRLKKYWQQRNRGKPVELSAKEKGVMLGWVLHLDFAFPEAVELFLDGPDPQIQDISLHDIEKSAHIENHPKAFADLLAYVLTHEDQPFWKCEDMITIIKNLMIHKELKPLLLEMCNHLLRLGCLEAAELADEVERISDN